jgi:O-antigen ligase
VSESVSESAEGRAAAGLALDVADIGHHATTAGPARPEGTWNAVVAVLVSAGLIAVTLAALPHKSFELDRYFVPKELVLHCVALVAAVMLVRRARAVTLDAADALLVLFLVCSAASSLFATNHWLAQRALGVSASSAVIFWMTRRLAAAGWHRPVLAAAALATVCGAATALAQSYGVTSEYFSLNRVPGGTFGNRNFVAHLAAIGLPALVYCVVTARRTLGAALGSVGVAVVAAVLVLSRTRAAWLAVIACAASVAIPLLAARRHWTAKRVRDRFRRLALSGAAGAGLAIFLPNQLNWNSDSPYLDSARGLVDYTTGSGRGRVTQYRNSARMAAANPILGVGPGNWPVHYAGFAPRGDPSLADDGMTANPWPSSDWMALLSERGVVAALALLGVFASLYLSGWRRWPEVGDGDAVLAKLTLLATITTTLVVSLFDAVLLLAAPSFLVWSVLGAASGVDRRGRAVTIARGPRFITKAALLGILGVAVLRSAMQTVAIIRVGTGESRAGWIAAASWDPGSYRINLRVAQLYAARGQCAVARGYARRALALFPGAPEARRVLRQCG